MKNLALIFGLIFIAACTAAETPAEITEEPVETNEVETIEDTNEVESPKVENTDDENIEESVEEVATEDTAEAAEEPVVNEDLDDSLAGFIGTWSGTWWDNTKATLTVKSINEQTAEVNYDWETGSYDLVARVIQNAQPEIQWENGPEKFSFAYTGTTLSGSLSTEEGERSITMRKQ